MAGILFDLDGVFYVGERAIPGAAETLAWVQKQGIAHCFLTNTTSKPRHALAAKLDQMGLHTGAERILTPPVAARDWIDANLGKARIALFVPPATESEFSQFESIPRSTAARVDAVVIGDLGNAWDYATLNQAFRLLMQQPPPKLIALGMTRYWLAADGLRLDVAAFVAALQHATGIAPIVLGKPAAPFFESALKLAGSSAGDSIMIGDDIRGDVAAAQAAGLRAILVHTGKFQPSDLQGETRPDGQLDSIADLPDWWVREFNP